jgi:hypothetical protein
VAGQDPERDHVQDPGTGIDVDPEVESIGETGRETEVALGEINHPH